MLRDHALEIVSAGHEAMKQTFLRSALLLFVALMSGHVEAQSFSCPIGKQATCLDYGDKVCSSFAKCVDQNAVCFDSYQCDYNGFTCKSNVLEIARKHDALVDDYNRLIETSRTLSGDYDDLVDEYDDLVKKSRALSDEYDNLEYQFDELKDCLWRADSLEEAKGCY